MKTLTDNFFFFFRFDFNAVIICNCIFQCLMSHNRTVHFFGRQTAKSFRNLFISNFFSLINVFTYNHFCQNT